MFRCMSYNIRYDCKGDGRHQWRHRKDGFCNVIRWHKPHIIGLQEVLHGQLCDIRKALPQYSFVGVGREGGDNGEYGPVGYLVDRWNEVASGTFWLSTSPDTPASRSWGTACTRICTWVLLHDKQSPDTVHEGRRPLLLVLNTHLDHRSREARVEGARLISQQIPVILRDHAAAAAGNVCVHVMVMGDMNATPNTPEVMEFHKADIGGIVLRDARSIATYTHGPVGTFTGFEPPYSDIRIDYILIGRRLAEIGANSDACVHLSGLKCDMHMVSHELCEGGLLASDHRPVMADLCYS